MRLPWRTLTTSATIVSNRTNFGKSEVVKTWMDAVADITKNKSKTLSTDLIRKLGRDYSKLPSLAKQSDLDQFRKPILESLAVHLGTVEHEIQTAVDSHVRQPSESTIRTLREVCTPKFEQIFHTLLKDNLQLGIPFLLHIREDLLQHMKSFRNSNDLLTKLRSMDASIKQLLQTWMSPETMEIRRITYEGTSAAIMEKIATKEAVHPLRSLQDLRARLAPDHRVFAAFHPLIPDEPLVFVHVALRSYIPTRMPQVLNNIEDSHHTVATFYSISSTQAGLSGVDLGQVLLKKATKLLQNELPSLHTFVTLSPIPRFRKWLQEKVCANRSGGKFVDDTLFSSDEIEILQQVFKCDHTEGAMIKFLDFLEDPNGMAESAGPIEPILMRLAARYLVQEKYRNKPLDGVARFHLQNGAELSRLNYLADPSRRGWHNSLGIMVNYVYKSDAIEKNKKDYSERYSIAVAPCVTELLPNTRSKL